MQARRILLTVPIQTVSKGNGLLDVGLGSVAAACRHAGWDVTLVDWNTQMTLGDLEGFLEKERFDLVGIKVFTQDFDAARRTLRQARVSQPSAATLMGGPHPTGSLPKDLWEEFGDDLDFAMAGDGEPGMMALLEAWNQAGGRPNADTLCRVPGLRFRDQGRIHANEPVFLEDLDSLPLRDLSLQDPRTYDFWESGAMGRVAPVHTGRGCPCRCGYCIAWKINGPKARLRSLESIQEEIHVLTTVYGVRRIHFMDNVFLSDRDRVEKLCRWLIEKRYRLTWDFVPTSYFRELLDPSLPPLLYRAGCTEALFGIESGSEAVLRRIHKNGSPEEYAQAVHACVRAGIHCLGFFMFGFPDETLEEMEQTLSFAMSLPFSARMFGICLPFPGTSSHGRLLEKHGIQRVDWGSYDFTKPSLLPSQASLSQVMAMRDRANREHLKTWTGIKGLGQMILRRVVRKVRLFMKTKATLGG